MPNKLNIKKTNILHLWGKPLIVLLIAICVFGAHRYQQTRISAQRHLNEIGETCVFVNERCDFLIQGLKASAGFSAPPKPETSVTIDLSLPQGSHIESAWIEGVNMYMGKVPVLLKQKADGQWSGWFMLGSCSEPKMNWQLRLNIKEQKTPHYLFFSTTH